MVEFIKSTNIFHFKTFQSPEKNTAILRHSRYAKERKMENRKRGRKMGEGKWEDWEKIQKIEKGGGGGIWREEREERDGEKRWIKEM